MGRYRMIEVKGLRRSYKTGDFVQKALDGVTLNFRDNEFVAVLGPSGSGKTTLLNILGGLDHADGGDIVINGTSTKDYRSSDWDTYRNHRIGFVFQSYNLIPHQSILSNVELALTLSGVGRAERKRRAAEALIEVGLGDHLHKRPSQLSGGQMQRVAIARALVNNPDIVLADEPTGALDTETGVQVMDILKKVADDRLVIMVTHNPELAEEYATRIVRLADGHIISDSDAYNPFNDSAIVGVPDPANEAARAASAADALAAATNVVIEDDAVRSKSQKKASMSFFTALALSFNNLMTKKGRTFLTAFAGSIGIIGIAAILALSNGVNNYILETEEDALTSYPLTVTKSSFDYSSLITATMGYTTGDDSSSEGGEFSSSNSIPESSIMTDMFAQVKNNDLSAFKKFLESDESGISPYVNTIQYNYGVEANVFQPDTSSGVTQLNPSSMKSVFQNGISMSALSSSSGMSSFNEMIDDREMLEDQMNVVVGRWPENYNEAVLVLNSSGGISDYTLYSIGVHDPSAMEDMVKRALNGEEVVAPETSTDFSYDDALGLTFKVVPASNMYRYNAEQNTWTDMSKDEEFMKEQVANGIDLKIVGVVQPASASSAILLDEGVAYTPELTRKLMEDAASSDIVKQQMANPDVDVFTGKTFEELQDSQASDFDMSSMFNVDEDALSKAFGFDTSSLDFSNMDLSGMDMSGLDMSALSFDADSLDMSGMDMSSAFDSDTMAALIANAPEPDFSQMNPSVSEEQQAAIATISGQITGGFTPYVIAQGGTLADFQDTAKMQQYWAAYLQTESVQQQVAQLNALLGQAYGEALQTAMQDYMTNQYAPYMQQAMGEMMAQAAQAMATELATEMAAQMAVASGQLGSELSSAIGSSLSSQMSGLSSSLQSAFSFDADAFANAIQFNMTQEDLVSLLTNYMNADELTYDGNLDKLGYASLDNPQSISIYPKDFPAKEEVLKIIDNYNERMTQQGNDDRTIQYSDIAGTLMSSVTDIVNMISIVLIAFVSISLVVSSIMIGIITYISVLERKKEIGILRAMGASKGNVANVFNAETIIEGLIAGVFAIAFVVLVSIPVNAIVETSFDVPNVMILPWVSGLILICVSVILTFVAGLIPSGNASRRDPVEALRTE